MAFGGYGGGGAWGDPVPAPAPGKRPAHNLLTFVGRFGPAAAIIEQWSFSLRTAAGPLVPAQAVELANDLHTTWGAHIGPLQGSNVALQEVVVAQVNGDGKWAKSDDGVFLAGRSTVADTPGTKANSTNYPTSVALCCTLMTARAGATGRGRIFLPMPQFFLGNDTLALSPADQLTIATAVKSFIAAVNAKGRDVGVFSSKGYASRVTGVRVGRVPDGMASRRRSMPEMHVPVAL